MKRGKRSGVTLKQVAEHAGVSRATASLIVRGSPKVSEETRKKVLESMRQLGYVYDRIAANLRSRDSTTVGLIIPEIGNPLFAELLIGVHQALDKEGYTVILGTTFEKGEKQEQLISRMLEYRVGGVIMSPVSGGSEAIERLRQWGIPVVLVYKEPIGGEFDYVGVDNVLGARMAVEHLIRKGHRRIAFLGGPPESSPWRDRHQGYVSALIEAGLPVDKSLVITSSVSRQGGIEAVLRVLELPDPPSAALCYNDLIALGVMQALKETGRIPGKDFAVIGFDNIPEAASYHPGLTTVSLFPLQVGAHAADLLHRRMMGMELGTQRIILKPELVIRESG